ncbi:autotransporter-associated beta strand repeat-containing protein [Phycisphaeraceae bacterium D3-23]
MSKQSIQCASARALSTGLVLSCLMVTPAFAADQTWTDANATGLWGEPTNWSGTAVPDEADTALLGPGSPAGFTLDLGGVNRAVEELTFSGSTGFTLNNGTLQLVARRLNATGSATHTINAPVAFSSQPFSPGLGPAFADIDGSATVHLAGGIDDAGFFSFTKIGTGTLVLSTANAFSTLTFISGGTLQLAHADALQNSTVQINVDLGLDFATFGVDANLGGIAGTGDLNLGAQNLTVTRGDYAGSISGTGSLTRTDGADLRLTGASTYSGGTFIEGGSLRLDNTTGSATGSGVVELMTGATIYGTGTIGGHVNAAIQSTTRPGDSGTGVLTYGSVSFDRSAKLDIEIGGRSVGSRHDQLRITGDADLDNRAFLLVTLVDDFEPELGDAFQILDVGGTQTGTFGRASLPALDGGLGWNLQDLGTTGEVRVDLLGDLNTDGFVGAADLDLLLAHWGRDVFAYDYSAGDASGDGVVGDADLQIVIAQFGNGTPGGTVPEPGSLAAIGIGLLIVARRRRGHIAAGMRE